MRRVLTSLIVGCSSFVVSAGSGCVPAAPAHAQSSAEPQAAAAPAPNAARALEISSLIVQKALAGVAALTPYARNFVPFTAADADAALRRGGRHREHVQPWTIMPSLFAWTPAPGKELWVLSGRAGTRALLILLYAETDGAFKHAASTVIDEPDATIAVGFSESYPKQLVWSTCYGCAGEGGTVRFADDQRVEITYR